MDRYLRNKQISPVGKKDWNSMAKSTKWGKCMIDFNFDLFAFSGGGEGGYLKIRGGREIGKRLN